MKRLFLLSFVFLCATHIFSQADLQPLVIVKLYKSETITLKTLKTRVEIYQKQNANAPITVEQREELLDAMIDEKLVVQAAQKSGMNITDSQVNEYFLNQMASQIGQQVTEKELADIVQQQTGLSLDDLMKKQVGMTLKEYKTFLKNQLLAQQYIISLKKDEIQTAAPTDAEIRNYYELNKANFVQSDMIKIFLVVVPKGKDPAQAEKKAKSLYDSLKNKKTTTEQMAKDSKKDTAEYKAGNMMLGKTEQYARLLGFKYQDILELFKKPLGTISDFNTTDTDYQFYQVLKKYDAKMLAISDVVQPESTDTVYEYIKSLLTQQKQQMAFMKASQSLSDSLNTPQNVERKKTGTALQALLAW